MILAMELRPIIPGLEILEDHIAELSAIKQAAIDFFSSVNHSGISVTFSHHAKCLCGNCKSGDAILHFENLFQLAHNGATPKINIGVCAE